MIAEWLIDIVQYLIFLFLIAAALYAITVRDLLNAVIAMGAFSLVLSLEFYILQAPDVAIAEAAIGAALVTAIYIAAIKATTRFEEGIE